MLELGFVREHLDVIEKMAADRGIALDLAPFRTLDLKRRELIKFVEGLKATRNKESEAIGNLMATAGAMGDTPDAQAQKALAAEKIQSMKAISEEIKNLDGKVTELDERMRDFLLTIPPPPHASVPVGHSAADNVEVRRSGAPPKFDFAPRPHWEIGERTGILDFASAIKISGARFAGYRGLGARL